MKTAADAEANRNPRFEILLVVGALALSGLCGLSVLSGVLASAQRKSEIIAVSLSSKQFADYSAATPSARMPAARLNLIAEVIHDTDPDANVQTRFNTVLANLRTPVPGTRAVYVTNIRLDPPAPKQDQDVTFYVTFLNTTGSEQTFRWFIFIYEEGQEKPFGQTSSDQARIIPAGGSEQQALNTWRMGRGEPCTRFTAKVHWVDAGSGKPIFTKPDGQEYVLPFTICP